MFALVGSFGMFVILGRGCRRRKMPRAGLRLSGRLPAPRRMFPRALRDAYFAQWHKENDPQPGQSALAEWISFRGPDFDDIRPHL